MKKKKVIAKKISHNTKSYFNFINSSDSSSDNLLKKFDFSNRLIYINGEINDDLAEKICRLIIYYNTIDQELEIKSPIKIMINSYGGYLTSGFLIYDIIKNSKTPVYTYNLGAAYSSASLIFLAGEKRYASKNASFLIHEGGVENCYKTASQFFTFSEMYKKRVQKLFDLYINETKLQYEQLQDYFSKDYWLEASEAKKVKLVTDIL